MCVCVCVVDREGSGVFASGAVVAIWVTVSDRLQQLSD